MMSQRSKRELVVAIHPRYLKASKSGKQQILNEFVAATGYHHKYAIMLLKHGSEPKGVLLGMSRSTIDRCLKAVRYEKQHGLSTTKPGALLKQAIAVRTWHDWDDAQPGFMEMDL